MKLVSVSSAKLVFGGHRWSRRKLEDTVTTVTAATPVSPAPATPASPPAAATPASSPDGVVDRQAERIGGRIRELRLARGLTLVQLAGIAELSHPFLSQLERGRARPSMVSLERIARALGSSQLELIAAAEDDEDSPAQSDVVVVRADEGTRGPYGDGQGRLLVHGRRRFHPMEFSGSNQEPGDFFEHEGDEFLHVVSGVVAVDLEGRETSVLKAGDSIYFAGGIRHRWRAIEPGGYRLFVVKERPEQR